MIKVLKADRPATLRTVRSGISRLSTDTGWHLCHLSRARMSHRAMVTSYITSHHISWLISFTDIDRHSVFSPNLRSYGPAHCWHWLTLLCSDQLERGRWPARPHSDSLTPALVTGCWLPGVIITPFKIMRNDRTALWLISPRFLQSFRRFSSKLKRLLAAPRIFHDNWATVWAVIFLWKICE